MIDTDSATNDASCTSLPDSTTTTNDMDAFLKKRKSSLKQVNVRFGNDVVIPSSTKDTAAALLLFLGDDQKEVHTKLIDITFPLEPIEFVQPKVDLVVYVKQCYRFISMGMKQLATYTYYRQRMAMKRRFQHWYHYCKSVNKSLLQIMYAWRRIASKRYINRINASIFCCKIQKNLVNVYTHNKLHSCIKLWRRQTLWKSHMVKVQLLYRCWRSSALQSKNESITSYNKCILIMDKKLLVNVFCRWKVKLSRVLLVQKILTKQLLIDSFHRWKGPFNYIPDVVDSPIISTSASRSCSNMKKKNNKNIVNTSAFSLRTNSYSSYSSGYSSSKVSTLSYRSPNPSTPVTSSVRKAKMTPTSTPATRLLSTPTSATPHKKVSTSTGTGGKITAPTGSSAMEKKIVTMIDDNNNENECNNYDSICNQELMLLSPTVAIVATPRKKTLPVRIPNPKAAPMDKFKYLLMKAKAFSSVV